MLVDSHCHLDRLDLAPYNGDLSAAIAAARSNGVSRMLCIGIDMDNAETVIEIARNFEGVSASVGVHPMDVGVSLADMDRLGVLASDHEVVAIGETGLDYHYSKEAIQLQQESFIAHLQLSAELAKPVVVHTREAREDTINIIRDHGNPDVAGVLHCFTESWEMARQALDLNYYISFSGIVTFKNAQDLREVAKKVPLERLLIETDSPYLAPVPYRGKKNEPKYVLEVAKCVAELRGIDLDTLIASTSENYSRLFFNGAQ